MFINNDSNKNDTDDKKIFLNNKNDDSSYYEDYTNEEETIIKENNPKVKKKGIILILSLMFIIPFIILGLNYIKKNVINNYEFKTTLKSFGILEKDTYQINYFVNDITYKVNFKTDNNKIIELNNMTGYIKGLKEGNCNIIVYDEKNNEVDKINITVSKDVIPLTDFNINDISIKVKETTFLTIKTIPSNTTDLKFTYQNDNEKIVTVTNTGIIKGRSKGTTYINVSNNNITKKIKVIVK